MAIQTIDTDTPQPNGKQGEPLRAAFKKVNDNFDAVATKADLADPSKGAAMVAYDPDVEYMEGTIGKAIETAGNADAKISTHDHDPAAHPELSSFISGEADRAGVAATQAEAARDAATVGADLYPDEATGRAAVADGEYFKTVSADPNVAAELYKRIDENTSESVVQYPSAEPVVQLKALQGVTWLDQAALAAPFSDWQLQSRIEVAKAIKAVSVEDAAPGEKYCIGVFSNQHETTGYRIWIYALSTGLRVAQQDVFEVSATGVTKRELGASPKITLWIDYREISTIGTVVNGGVTPLVIAPFTSFGVLDAEKAGKDQIQRLDSSVNRIETGVGGLLTNKAINGALDPAGAEVLWRQTATVTVVPSLLPAPIVLASKGIKQVAGIGSTAPYPSLYKREPLTPQQGNKYFVTSAYVISGDGVTYPTFSISLYTNGNTGVTASVTNRTNGFIQIDATTRLYWQAGHFPDRDDLGFFLLGGARSSIEQGQIGGYTLAFSETPIGLDDVLKDNWSGRNAPSLADIGPLEVRVSALEGGTGPVGGEAGQTLPRAIRVALAGSSITWGSGYLGQGSYVFGVEDFLRNQMAQTVHAADMTLSGSFAPHLNSSHYKGSAIRLSGVGSQAQFDLTGDECSLVLPRERGNADACVAELYVDDVLFDTFDVFNGLPYQEGIVKSFTGDGSQLKFDLGQCWTFDHVVTVGGVTKTGSVNTGGSGAGIPSGSDYSIIRQMVMVGDVPQVHHVLWFAAAPVGEVVATFSAGESIQYMRSFLGNAGKGLDTSLENPYGDGRVAYDPANPSSLSSGLGFRQSDDRAVKSWRFSSSKKRTFRIKIMGLSVHATGATPRLWINFATNRMHHIQNAGIGGWEAKELLQSTDLNSIKYVNKFRPDIALLEFCTNDDNAGVHLPKAWVTKTGQTDAWVRAVESAKYLKKVTYVSADNYTVEDERLPVAAITEHSATLDMTGGTFNIEAGDVIIFGDFRLDNRRQAVRIVTDWDADTGVVSWGKALQESDLIYIESLQDLVGSTVRVRNAPTFLGHMRDLTASLRAENPDVQVIYGTGGIPNDYVRRLVGYREMVNALTRDQKAGFADFYGQTLEWAYSQPTNATLYLDATKSQTSTGDASYPLYLSSGQKPNPIGGGTPYWRLMITSVKVDGIERLNRGCHIEGGRTTGWSDDTAQMSIANAQAWGRDYTLVFDSDAPAAGAQIVVSYNTSKWANDDCHPSPEVGRLVFPFAIFAPLEAALQRSVERLGQSF
ncbi:hypothetical protein [Allopusillimonas ginsengisoli]|uniref:hypothetical protein n=1 Tax=Allopusillimonas ginsengisoli TaxID=453575 RepID=UPI00102264BB|nr:hypothetical protein [Allopusillimonas ginsengisoli]TEA79846.1 hypothetical protein ERE07_02595 [Allopusillimonas ginsengisoli]